MRSGEESEYLLQHRIARVGRGDVGGYSCHLTTSYDSLKSRPAALTVRSASRIIKQPQHQTVTEGATAQFRLREDTIKNREMEINLIFQLRTFHRHFCKWNYENCLVQKLCEVGGRN